MFGVSPLQQYLLPLDDGRLQALSIAWDARPATAGGQRWYHLYPEQSIDHRDPLHWTGPYQNWNARCAECHSTNLEKNYSAVDRRYDTRFSEEDVACEACHGPGSEHVRLARAGETVAGEASGLLALARRGVWTLDAGQDIAQRSAGAGGGQQLDTCGRCHARRGNLGTYRHGQPLSDTHRLSLLGEPLYFHDGQIRDEVYVYGSFLQSRMHRAGVVCSDCHEPHSNAPRLDGNAVCTQCHRAAVYDAPAHHHHDPGDESARCVSCHMPARTYMGVDARRDHSLRVPRPDLTAMIGTPNACNGCHAEKDALWAVERMRDWGWSPAETGTHPALAMEAATRGDARGVPRLLTLARDTAAATIWRATALERGAALAAPEALRLAEELLLSTEPLLRVTAARSLGALPPGARLRALYPLHGDPVTGVRMAVAAALADAPLSELDAGQRNALLALFDEYLAIQARHADMPSVQVQLGLFHLARGNPTAAEQAYREALRQNPQVLPARLNLADLLRAVGRDAEARELLQEALAFAADSGDLLHALGLLEARAGNREQALRYLGDAAGRETGGHRDRFVHAVALHDYGDGAAALAQLRALHRALPAQEQVLLALVNYSAELGNRAAARDYAQRLLALAPDNPTYRQLAARFQAR